MTTPFEELHLLKGDVVDTRPVFLFDLDGTLSDCAHRLRLIPDWDAFYDACPADSPIYETMRIATSLSFTCDIWIVTGRNERVREQTLDWLVRMGLPPSWLRFMRKSEDRRPDFEIKREWFRRLPKTDRARVVGVFENRQRVVDMWRQEGLICYQVAPGNY